MVAADLPNLIRFAIGSGLLIGELCARRWIDLNLDGIPVVSAEDIRLVPGVAVRQNVGLGWMTPHTWRRTYATILDDEMSLTDRAKADLMGQAKFLKDTYVCTASSATSKCPKRRTSAPRTCGADPSRGRTACRRASR